MKVTISMTQYATRRCGDIMCSNRQPPQYRQSNSKRRQSTAANQTGALVKRACRCTFHRESLSCMIVMGPPTRLMLTIQAQRCHLSKNPCDHRLQMWSTDKQRSIAESTREKSIQWNGSMRQRERTKINRSACRVQQRKGTASLLAPR